MQYRVLTCLAVLGLLGCGAGSSMEEVGVASYALNVANGTEFKNKLTADPNGSFTLTADIDMNNAPLFVTSFYGTLDGAGHTIKNVKQLLSSSSGQAGLFGTLQGTVKNLKLDNVNVKAQSAGGLASNCAGATIQNVTVKNSNVEAGASAGGICGYMSGGSLTSSSAAGVVKSTGGYAGGLFGSTSIGRSGNGVAVTSGSVAAITVTGVQATGGLIGYCQDPIILRSTVDATVSGQAATGGICGEMNGGHINYSYARGTSLTSSAGPAGGIVGKAGIGVILQLSDRIEIRASYSQFTNVTGATEAGGIVGTGKDPLMYDVYTKGNVTGSNAVGGLIGRAQTDTHGWALNNGIFRGAVVDRSRNWAGVVGVADLSTDIAFRWTTTLFNVDLETRGDPYLQVEDRQKPVTGAQLTSPSASAQEGVYCWGDYPACGDSSFPDEQWSPNAANQHHTLKDMPGPNSQPK